VATSDDDRPAAYDAVVIGAGLTGGWAAKELTERGLTTCVLERGPDPAERAGGDASGLVVDEAADPYAVEPGTAFAWFRCRAVGGRGLVWSRQAYRLSDLDLEANARDGHGVDWPIRYADLAPWYDRVERFLGLQGSVEGIAHLPDGVDLLPTPPLHPVAAELGRRLAGLYGDARRVIPARRLRAPARWDESRTLDAARATGRLTLRPHALVTRIEHDAEGRRATGVRVVDVRTRATSAIRARVIFVCASAIESARLLLHSRSPAFPDGLGNRSGALGRYLMDHVAARVDADLPPPVDPAERWPGTIPRFRNVGADRADFVRGYQSHVTFLAGGPDRDALILFGFGEQLPDAANRVVLDPDRVDAWGVPLVRIACRWGDNDRRMHADMVAAYREMLTRAGYADARAAPIGVPGAAVHEMGTARMGKDPRTSVLDATNRCHDVPNVFVTDGACMPSSPPQNPTLTYLALTARAGAHAAELIARGAL
jgi:choline dehydrogenase-like flavoprotein